MFSHQVLAEAARDLGATLRLEHHLRMQTAITQLVTRHLGLRKPRPNEFVDLVLRSENVHIVTFEENYSAMKADGDYGKAGIRLREWHSLPGKCRQILWAKMLRGRVANAAQFEPR